MSRQRYLVRSFFLLTAFLLIGLDDIDAEATISHEEQIDKLFDLCGFPYAEWSDSCHSALDRYFLQEPISSPFKVIPEQLKWNQILANPERSYRGTVRTLNTPECLAREESRKPKYTKTCRIHDLVRLGSLKILCSLIVKDSWDLGVDLNGDPIVEHSILADYERRYGRSFTSAYEAKVYLDLKKERSEEFRRNRKHSFLYDGWRRSRCQRVRDVVVMKVPNIHIDEYRAWTRSPPEGVNFGIHPVNFSMDEIAAIFERRGSMYQRFKAWFIRIQGNEVMQIAVRLSKRSPQK